MQVVEPRVTVGLLVHNAEATLEESVRSVLAQTCPHFRLLLSDDASTDESLALCRRLAAEDDRITVQSHPTNVGGIANFNSVVAPATTEYFVWFSDHDVWHPEFLERCLAELDAHPKAVLCYAGVEVVDVRGAHLRLMPARVDTRDQPPLSRYAITAWGVPSNTACVYGVMRTSALRRLAAYPDIYPNSIAPDVLLLLELALVGEFLFVDEPLYKLREFSEEHTRIESYLERLHLSPRSRWDAMRGVARFFRHARSASTHQIPTWRARRTADMIYVSSFVTNYRPLLRALVAVPGRRSS